MLYDQSGNLQRVPNRFQNEHARIAALAPLHEKKDNHTTNYKDVFFRSGKNNRKMFSIQERFRLKGAV